MRLPVLAAALVLGALGAGCTEMNQAALVDPGEQRVAADAGDLRVLHHHDDPPAGDEWVDVLEPDPGVVTRTGQFREDGSRHAEDDQAADLRLLYEGAGEGRTVFVRMNCRGCRHGVPASPPEDVELLVWEFVVGDAGDRQPTLGTAAIGPGRARQVDVGDHVVVVRAAGHGGSVEGLDGEVLRLVASHAPAGAGDLAVDVFAAVGSGETTFRYGAAPLDDYVVRVS